MEKGQNTNRPAEGSSISVEPIRQKKHIADLKTLLKDKPLDHCLFITGINTNLRASDLLSLKVDEVKNLKPGDSFEVKERKTKKKKRVNLNKAVVDSIQNLVRNGKCQNGDFLFIGQRGNVLSVPSLNLKIKRWMKRLNIKGNYGCHTLRKTWAFQQYKHNNATLPQLMKALNHSSQAITLRYLGIQEKELADLYAYEV